MGRPKAEIVTFKADESLVSALQGVPNRSEFIRGAIQAALDGACPLCMGTGTLTPDQKAHWEQFAQAHSVVECSECHGRYLVCDRGKGRSGAPSRTRRRT